MEFNFKCPRTGGRDKSIHLFSILKIIGSLTKRAMRTGKKSASDFRQKRFGFYPKGTANLRFQVFLRR